MKTNNAIKNVDKVVNCQAAVTSYQLPVGKMRMSIAGLAQLTDKRWSQFAKCKVVF